MMSMGNYDGDYSEVRSSHTVKGQPKDDENAMRMRWSGRDGAQNLLINRFCEARVQGMLKP